MGRAQKQPRLLQQQEQQQEQPERPPEPPQQPLASPFAAVKLSRKQLRAQAVNEHMLLVPGALTVPEAQRFIDIAEAVGFSHQGSRGPAFGEAFRDNHRLTVNDPALAQQLWSSMGLAQLMAGVQVDGASPVGCNPNMRFYRYSAGQRFGRHIDDAVEVGQPGSGLVTGYTLLVYLSGQQYGSSGSGSSGSSTGGKGSSGKGGGAGKAAKGGKAPAPAPAAPARPNTSALQELVGGETVFYRPRGRVVASVQPAVGLCLLHLHGEERCLEHEAAPVVRGVKYVLRSDVVFAAPS